MSDEGDEKIRQLSTLEIPVQIFILFLVKNRSNFTVNDMIREFELKHRVTLTYNRMNQILNELTEAGNLKKEMRTNGQKSKLTAYYTFNKLE